MTENTQEWKKGLPEGTTFGDIQFVTQRHAGDFTVEDVVYMESNVRGHVIVGFKKGDHPGAVSRVTKISISDDGLPGTRVKVFDYKHA